MRNGEGSSDKNAMKSDDNILYYQKQKNMTQEQLADVLFVDGKMMKHRKRILR